MKLRICEMKFVLVLSTLACIFNGISTQGDHELRIQRYQDIFQARHLECGNMWVKGCVEKVIAVPAGRCQCAPYLEESSNQDQAAAGGLILLVCLFFGYPTPTMSWTGPQNSLPAGRHSILDLGIAVVINDLTSSDEGNYTCSGVNAYGRISHTLQIRVVDMPKFNNTANRPHNVSVTEGESVTFNCHPFAVPEAAIVWFENGQPINTDSPPTRFVFSSDNRSLTIRDVCRDCFDRESGTDRTLIQCNASNIHGYAFAQGYLNVLMKTKVEIRGPRNVSVDFLVEKQFVFQCSVTSDPSTPITVQWHKIEPRGDLHVVGSEPPYVNVTNEFLTITTGPDCTSECAKYLGEYICVGSNGYSRENQTIALHYAETSGEKEETWGAWAIILVAGAIGIVVLLIGMLLRSRLKESTSDVKRQVKNRRLPNLPSIYEDVGYDSIGFSLDELAGNKDGFATTEYNMYDHVGYESINHVQEVIAFREETMHPASGMQAMGSDRPRPPLPDEGSSGDDRGHPIPSEDVTNGGYIDRHQACRSESFTNEAERFPTSNSQSEPLTTFSGISREEPEHSESNLKEVNTCLDLVSTDVKPCLDLVSTDVKPCLDLVSTEVNPCLDLVSTEVNPYLDLVSTDAKPCLDLVSTEVNPYLDLISTEVNPYLDLVSTEVNPYLDLVSTEVNPYLDLVSTEVNPYLDLVSTDAKPCLDLVSTEVNPYLDLVSTEVNPYLDLVSTEVNPYLDLVSTEVSQNFDLGPGPKKVNQYLELDTDTKDLSQCIDLDPREVNQYIELDSEEVNQIMDLALKDSNQNRKLGTKELNHYMGLGSREVNMYMELGGKEVIQHIAQVKKN